MHTNLCTPICWKLVARIAAKFPNQHCTSFLAKTKTIARTDARETSIDATSFAEVCDKTFCRENSDFFSASKFGRAESSPSGCGEAPCESS